MEAPGITFPLPNVILGTSASDQGTFDAVAPHMRALAAAGWHTVWSLEPLLGPIDMRGKSIPCEQELLAGSMEGKFLGGPFASWVIVGGEGHGARPCNVEWIRSIVRQCKAAGLPCFVKQVGSHFRTDGSCPQRWHLRDRKGGDITEWPAEIQVREMPEVLR